MPPDSVLRAGVGEIRQAHQPHVALADRRALLGRRRCGWRASCRPKAMLCLHRQPGKDAVFLEDHAAVGPGAGDRLAIEQ